MIFKKIWFIWIGVVGVGLMVSGCGRKSSADLILLNGKIFTARDSQHLVQALAIRGERVVFAGSSENALRWKGDYTRVLDLEGRLVVPGFHDAHLHFWSGAHLRNQLNLGGLRSKKEVLEAIRREAERKQSGDWIIGRGWDHELWEVKELPTCRDLDRVAPDNPVFLKRVDGHMAWVNSRVLKMVGFQASSEDPPGGRIVRFPHSRQPSGILIDTAYELVEKLIPEPTSVDKVEMLSAAIQYANALGLTGVTDNSPGDIYAAYAELYRQKRLKLRIHFWTYGGKNLDSLRNFFSRFEVDPHFLHCNLVKFFADGSMGSRSAYLLEPYDDDPGNTGLPQHSSKELYRLVANADSGGWQIGIHAIGDAANRLVLDVYQRIQQENPRPDRRWRIEHAQMVLPEDVQRFARLGVIASMQPSHCISDLKWVEKRIGDRARFTYSWRSMLENGVSLAFGTDWPVEPLNPMIGIYAAVTRQDTLGNPPDGWYPEQRLTMGEALYAYTYGAAFAARAEGWQGRLLPGYVADLVILDRDLFTIPPAEILRTRPLITVLGGKVVYQRPDSPIQWPEK